MKNFKKVLLTGTITLMALLAMSAMSNAATVKVTGEVVNIRKEASTASKVVAQLSENVECEYLGEEGDWYKVKYQKYTGYVSKQYTKLIGEPSNNTEEPNTDDNNQANSQSNEQSDNSGNSQTINQTTQTNNNTENNQANTTSSTQQNNDTQSEQNDTETVKLVYKKFNKDTIIRILPLIHSSNIGEAKKDAEVLILTETSGWSYVQTDEISGWVRTDTLGEAKTVTAGEPNKDNGNDTTTEETGYISEEEVNMRKGAGTSYAILKVLKLNTQVTILKEEGKWYQIKVGDDTGYVSKSYVSDKKVVTNRSLTEPRTEKEDDENKTTAVSENSSNKNTSTTNESKTTSNKADKTTDTTKTNTTGTSNKVNTNNTTDKNQNTTSKDAIKGTDVIAYAKKYLGHKYVWAGAKPGGFDCSGFTMYVYKHFGVSLPHYTVSQYNSSKGKKITKQSDLKMGDIVFLTDYVTGAPCGHCGIYISNGEFIHADSSVGYVNISSLNGIYKGRFCGALRVNGVGN